MDGGEQLAEKTSVTGKIIIIEKNDDGYSLTVTSAPADSGCRVRVELDGDGEIISKGCTNDSCDGNCKLNEKKNGSKLKMWCTCSPHEE